MGDPRLYSGCDIRAPDHRSTARSSVLATFGCASAASTGAWSVEARHDLARRVSGQHFQRDQPARRLLLGQIHRAVGTLAEDVDEGVVVCQAGLQQAMRAQALRGGSPRSAAARTGHIRDAPTRVIS